MKRTRTIDRNAALGELEECPFCGNNNQKDLGIVSDVYDCGKPNTTITVRAFVRCYKCLARGPETVLHTKWAASDPEPEHNSFVQETMMNQSKESARFWWNTRKDPKKCK